jgi:hypothetical protein
MHTGLLLVVVMGITACTGNKDTVKHSDLRVVQKRERVESHDIQRMQVSKVEKTITFGGKEYTFLIQRVPNDSLPPVKNDVGEEFADNTITLRVTRGNEKIFNKTFTKQSFSSLVDSEFMKHAILGGMVFDKTTPQGLVYAASVSYPQTDLYIPVSITITPDGKMSMEKAKEELMEEI